MANSLPWWKRGVIYHVLVPSYFDSNGDGVGDLRGLSEKLDYLKWLGVDAIWLSPIHPSPMADMGYDIVDFTAINPQFGTLEDFDQLIAEAHRRSLRVILDWICNHSSSEHPWFQESRSSRDNPKRDWYIWRDPAPGGGPPNNWISVFGGSMWTLDEHTGQYYLHSFLDQMPDLNWFNDEMALAQYEAMRFWLDRGVDGFRLDAIDMVVKDMNFPDNPENPDFDPEKDAPDNAVFPKHTRDQPRVHKILAAMRRIVNDYGERVLLGELHLGIEQVVTYYGKDKPELHLPLNPRLLDSDWATEHLQGNIDELVDKKPDDAWPCWMVSSHDDKRIATRAGPEQAAVAAMLLLCLPGTPVIYYGDEIGMHDVEIPPERERDPQGKLIGRKRDPMRTPMQWNAEPHAGFSSTEPWLPVAEDFDRTNVDNQDGKSLLALHRALLALRRENPSLSAGRYAPIHHDEQLLVFQREGEGGRLLVLLNLSAEARRFDLAPQGGSGRVLLSTFLDRKDERVSGELDIRGHEGLITKME